MRLIFTAPISVLAGYAIAAPYYPFPLHDGFPKPSAAQLTKIETAAGGSLPNSPLPTKLEPAAVASLQLIAANEIFEVAYFDDLLHNITTNVRGYDLYGYNRTFVIETITAIKNQEELHALGANGVLASAKATQIQPCKYTFPVSDYLSAIALANTFTDVVLGVLPMAQTVWATDGGDETPLVTLFGSVIAQEAEQNGWYRSVQHKVPSAAPFLTTEGPAFAWTFLQGVIVPNSCPNNALLKANFPTFGALTVVSKPSDKNSKVKYSVPDSVSSSANSIVYLSGGNLPVTVSISNVETKNHVSTFDAELPFQEGFAKGLTVAAVVEGAGSKFTSAAAVADATLYGPGIIEVD